MQVVAKIAICSAALSVIGYQIACRRFRQPSVGDKRVVTGDGNLCKRDLELMKLTSAKQKPHKMEDTFYEMVMSPLETVCARKIRFGGVWRGWGYDGGKVLCMDDFDESQPCLVYSFGLRGEISFEEAMLELGCEVHGYDLNINEDIAESFRNGSHAHHQRMHIKAKFIGGEKEKGDSEFVQLEDELAKNGHKDRKINYLKLDVEGSERALLPEWIESGMLENVEQLGIEMHEVVNLDQHYLEKYDTIVRRLHHMGFRMIYWECNMLKMYNWHSVHCSTFEIVFIRKKSYCET